MDWLKINACVQVGVAYMNASSKLSVTLDSTDAIRDLARATGTTTDMVVDSSCAGVGWLVIMYGGPEFLIGDHFGVYLETGYAFEEIPVTHVSKVIENDVVQEQDIRKTTIKNSGPWASIGVKVRF